MAHNRQELLDQTVAAIRPQVDTVMVMDNASDPKLTVPEGVGTMFVPDQPPNLAKFWNMGLDFFLYWYKGRPHDVALLCDDAIVPEGWFSAVVIAMREADTTAGSSNPWGRPHGPMVKRDADSDIMNRMCSWAFIVDGTRLIRADDSMHWWWFDTDFDISCRRDKGTVLIGTHPVPNQQPNHFTNLKPELGEQAGRDREAFAAKHGRTPW
jgi:glycosyltransferase involved in cell wall biosynthesis